MRESLMALMILVLVVVPTVHAKSPPPLRPVPVETEVAEKLPPPPPASFLAKITAPPVQPVIKTPQGYSVRIDLSRQVLNVRSPKEQVWISPQVEAHQTVKVTRDDAPLQQDSTALAKLKKGRILYARAEKDQWVHTQILEGGKTLQGWVLKKYLEPVAEAAPPQKTLRSTGEEFASSAQLIQKAKQFDDGLYAAVELAMQNGLGPVNGKKEWLPRLASQVDAKSGGAPLAQLFAAAELGGNPHGVPPVIAKLVQAQLKDFQADDKRSKPLGFYSWSKELEGIFRQDRMLQGEFNPQKDSVAVTSIARALAADTEARRDYETVLRLNERLTNKLTGSGYRSLLAEIDAGQSPRLDRLAAISFFPSSRSHESDLVMKLFQDQAIPNNFDLMAEVIKRLKSGQLSFQPRKDSGWYDHQLWSLEPLVRFDATPEAKKLVPNDEYRKHLEELFKGTYALMRETHVKQLALPAPSVSAEPPPKKEREKVFIAPDPLVELLPTMYLRRAESYRFVRDVLTETFGKEHLSQMHRLTAQGPVEMNLAAELEQVEQLFSGAYLVACRDLGMVEALPAGLGDGQSADAQTLVYLRWVASLASDPDLAPDARMMVPSFYDRQRKLTKVWVMVGWEHSQASFDYATQPTVTITDPDGKPVGGEDAPEIIFHAAYRSLATPVFAEVYVSKLYNRAEFRRHCDTYQSKAAILANLE